METDDGNPAPLSRTGRRPAPPGRHGTPGHPDDLRAAIRRVRDLTDRPFGVNLLMLEELRDPDAADELEETDIAAVHETLNPVRATLGLPAKTDRPPKIPDLIGPALEVIIEEHVPVFSAGLGDPGSDLTSRLHDAGIMTVVMVTNRDDAVSVEANGADVIVAQGWEGGGHRSHFTKPAADRLADLGSLVLTASYDDAASDLGEALPFPAQYLLNSDIFAAALNADDADNLPLWAGQSAGRLNDLPWAADVIGETVREARDLLQRTLPERVTLA